MGTVCHPSPQAAHDGPPQPLIPLCPYNTVCHHAPDCGCVYAGGVVCRWALAWGCGQLLLILVRHGWFGLLLWVWGVAPYVVADHLEKGRALAEWCFPGSLDLPGYLALAPCTAAVEQKRPGMELTHVIKKHAHLDDTAQHCTTSYAGCVSAWPRRCWCWRARIMAAMCCGRWRRPRPCEEGEQLSKTHQPGQHHNLSRHTIRQMIQRSASARQQSAVQRTTRALVHRAT